MVGCLRRSIAVWIAVWATAALPAAAQITTGTISGSVRDSQGAVVPGATVTLVSAARGTTADTQTSAEGDFVFPNVTSGTYLVRVTMDGFKTLERPGVVVSPGDRLAVPTLTIEVGALAETVTVQGDSPVIQASSGERSFTVATESVENLPISNRGFASLAGLAPGVSSGTNPARIGGGGQNNIMMDGISTMDTGNNGILLQMNVESIAEVKVLTSSYQAEYGRSSGLQITAVTKSGTNKFRGSLYGVFRDSDWNSNSRVNELNRDPKTVLEEKDLGYSIGGPIGRPGGNNKLFFFYSHEYAPRTGGNNVVRYRMPTELERRGDFSQTYDNNGSLFRFIRDTQSPFTTCSAADTRGCFADGDVLGRIPANRLYQTGVNLLKLYPLPNIDGAGLAYNYELTRPTEKARAMQPAIRVDYQPTQKLRATVKYAGFSQRNQVFNGTLPGFNDAQQQDPVISTLSMTANYNLNSSTFLEATYGQSQNAFGGCIFGQAGTGPVFCTTGIPRNQISNRDSAGLGGLPMIFPDALALDTRYYAYQILEEMQPPFWVDGQIRITPTSLTWGNRLSNATPNYAPPSMTYPGFLNINATKDVAFSLTRVAGRHTLKTGFYNNHSRKSQNQNSGATFGALNFSNDTSNPIDAQFGFANAVLGVFTSYNQLSRYIEGRYIYDNTEGYVQDNWKVNNKLTLDYGVAAGAPAAAVRLARPGVELPAGRMEHGPGAAALRRRLRQRRQPVFGGQPAGERSADRAAARCGVGDRDRHHRAEHREHAERPVPLRRRHLQDHLYLSAAARRAALRHGLRPDRQSADCLPGRRRIVLRPAERQRHLRAGDQPAGGPERHRSLRAAAGPEQRLVDRRRADAEHLSVRCPAALVVAVECRRPDDAALVDLVGSRLHRPAQLEHAPGGEHQRRRFRDRVPAGVSGPDAGGQRHARGLGPRHRSVARLSRLRRDQPPDVDELAHVPRHQPVVPAALHPRRGVRIQRHDHPRTIAEQRGAAAARPGRFVLVSRRTRRRPTSCSRPIRSSTR